MAAWQIYFTCVHPAYVQPHVINAVRHVSYVHAAL